jgi:ADP-ribose pyrophosphatase
MSNKQQSDSSYPVPDTWQAAHCVYKGARFDVCSLEIKTLSGETVRRETVVHPGAVVILPVMDDGHILMIHNRRWAIGETLWELPAGTLEPNEPPIETAKRELVEETGYKADNVTPLLQFYSSPGFCTEVLYCFVAKNLHFVGQNLDETEEIDVEALSWDEIELMLKNQTIRDSKTISTLLYFRHLS